MEFLIDHFYIVFTAVLIFVAVMLLTLSFYRAPIRCDKCGEFIPSKEYPTHFCRERYLEFSQAEAKKTGGTVHSVKSFKLESGGNHE